MFAVVFQNSLIQSEFRTEKKMARNSDKNNLRNWNLYVYTFISFMSLSNSIIKKPWDFL